MSEQKINTTATVKITVEVSLRQPWSPTETAENIYRTASEEAVNHVQRVLHGDRYCRIVGKPEPTLVVAPMLTV